MSIADELQSLTPSAKLEFFVVDATLLGGGVMRFHNGTNKLTQPVTWQGQAYQYLPIEASGFDMRADGPRPRPSLTVGDVYGLIGAEVRLYSDLAGATLIRKRTHARFLDAVNFPGGVNASADPTEKYPDEIWKFDRVKSRDGTQVSWELVSPLDLEDVLLPARQVRNTAVHLAATGVAECGYGGGPVATANDARPRATRRWMLAACCVSGCKLRFGDDGGAADRDLPRRGRSSTNVRSPERTSNSTKFELSARRCSTRMLGHALSTKPRECLRADRGDRGAGRCTPSSMWHANIVRPDDERDQLFGWIRRTPMPRAEEARSRCGAGDRAQPPERQRQPFDGRPCWAARRAACPG